MRVNWFLLLTDIKQINKHSRIMQDACFSQQRIEALISLRLQIIDNEPDQQISIGFIDF